MAAEMIGIRRLGFRYSGSETPALSDITLSVEEGGFLGIIGPGGAGKSTLAYAINGVIPHHFRGDFYGEAIIDGIDTVGASPQELALRVGSVLQDIDSQMVASVVEDEMLFGLENFGVPRGQIEQRIEGALAAAGISDLRARSIRSLSGGQKQKVAIAAILALLPKIIVLDEPTGELDPQASRGVFETLRALNREHGITVVVVEQKIMLLCEFAKRLAVMQGGRLVLEGEVGGVLQSAELLEDVGVNIPRIATLARELRKRGLYGGATPLNIAQAKAMVQSVAAGAAEGGAAGARLGEGAAEGSAEGAATDITADTKAGATAGAATDTTAGVAAGAATGITADTTASAAAGARLGEGAADADL
jgi:energy-coupling factor transport system ATP-binding protein